MKDNSLQSFVSSFREQLTEMFSEKDRDNDGKLSFEEFTGQETKIEKAFRAMDRDGDGYITRGEFAKVCSTLKPEQVSKEKLCFIMQQNNLQLALSPTPFQASRCGYISFPRRRVT
jgi:Ca2+-binding EF-hand superfamily protein